MSIPWLHVIREHPSFLKEYEELFSFSNTCIHALKTIGKKARNKASWLRQFWRALCSNGEPWKASQPLSGSIDVLFISHLINDADVGKASDFYFGNLPDLIQAEGHRVLVALIDHTAKPDTSRALLWGKNTSPRLILSGNLDIHGELFLYRKLRKTSSRLAIHSRRNESSFLKRVFERASLEAMSAGARSSLRLSEQVKRLVASVNPKMLVVTYEGHAWERMAFSAAREADAGVMCVGYLHAAIFRLQHSALRKLGKTFDPDLILTAGAVSKKQIENNPAMHGIPVRILGSNRAFKLPTTSEDTTRDEVGDTGQVEPLFTERNVCLVLPEGILSECLILAEFCLSCAELLPEMRFIFRLHPLISPDTLRRVVPRLRKPPANVEISQTSLEDDIKRATCALYRGSTAIVKVVCSGVQPVYLAKDGEMTIDPLYEMANLRVTFRSPEGFKSIIRGEKTTPSKDPVDMRTPISYCQEFYCSADHKVIVRLIN